MNFWAIAYKYQEDVFYDIGLEDDVSDLSETCFLPTKEMAEQFIEDKLGIDYVPVTITVGTLQSNGVWSYSRGTVNEWDEEY